jgi:hypothetical protein
MNSTTITEWLMTNQNMTLVSVVQQAIALFISLLIFIKSYDFESCLKSVRDQREAKVREKERVKLAKFQKMLDLAKSNQSIDLAKLAVSEDDSEEEKEEPVLRIAKKKKRSNVDSAV